MVGIGIPDTGSRSRMWIGIGIPNVRIGLGTPIGIGIPMVIRSGSVSRVWGLGSVSRWGLDRDRYPDGKGRTRYHVGETRVRYPECKWAGLRIPSVRLEKVTWESLSVFWWFLIQFSSRLDLSTLVGHSSRATLVKSLWYLTRFNTLRGCVIQVPSKGSS